MIGPFHHNNNNQCHQVYDVNTSACFDFSILAYVVESSKKMVLLLKHFKKYCGVMSFD